MVNNLNELLLSVKNGKKRKIVIAAAEDLELLEVVELALEENIADFILIGDQDKIINIAKANEKNINCQIINEPDHRLAAEKAVTMVKNKEADVIMKGLLHTSTFLKAVLNKEKGLNSGKQISQITVINKVEGDGLQLITDCAMTIEPNLQQKVSIVENAVYLAKKLGYDRPRVALLSAIEVVNPDIKDSVEAAAISKMSDRGQIKNAIVDGPFALDNAINAEAASHKGVSGEVAGKADVLVVPNLQVGNVLSKAITYYAKLESASAVVGTAAPIVMTSRSDTVKNKLMSIILASYIS